MSLAVRGDADAQRRLTGLVGVVEPHGVAGTMAAAAASGHEVAKAQAAIARLAEERQLVVFSDEIYDQMLYGDAEHVPIAVVVEKPDVDTADFLAVFRNSNYFAPVVMQDMRQAEEAIELLKSEQGESYKPGTIEQRLKLYLNRQPYREVK